MFQVVARCNRTAQEMAFTKYKPANLVYRLASAMEILEGKSRFERVVANQPKSLSMIGEVAFHGRERFVELPESTAGRSMPAGAGSSIRKRRRLAMQVEPIRLSVGGPALLQRFYVLTRGNTEPPSAMIVARTLTSGSAAGPT